MAPTSSLMFMEVLDPLASPWAKRPTTHPPFLDALSPFARSNTVGMERRGGRSALVNVALGSQAAAKGLRLT